MLKMILTWGVLAGAVVGVPLSILTATSFGSMGAELGMAIGYLLMLLSMGVMFVAVKRHRDRALGGVIRFFPALGVGLAISLVATVIYVLSWEAALALTNTDFITQYANGEIERMRAAGASAAELAQKRAEMDGMIQAYANPLFRMGLTAVEMLVPVGLLAPLVAAALLSNPRFLPARAAA